MGPADRLLLYVAKLFVPAGAEGLRVGPYREIELPGGRVLWRSEDHPTLVHAGVVIDDADDYVMIVEHEDGRMVMSTPFDREAPSGLVSDDVIVTIAATGTIDLTPMRLQAALRLLGDRRAALELLAGAFDVPDPQQNVDTSDPDTCRVKVPDFPLEVVSRSFGQPDSSELSVQLNQLSAAIPFRKGGDCGRR